MTTPPFRLRRIEQTDAVAFQTLVTDPQVRAFLGGPMSQDYAAQRFDGLLTARVRGLYRAVDLSSEGGMVGLLSMTPHKDGDATELSYEFMPQVWGRGIAFEACAAFLKTKMLGFGLTRVIAETQVANLRSVRLLQRLGFVEFDRVKRFDAPQVLMERQLELSET